MQAKTGHGGLPITAVVLNPGGSDSSIKPRVYVHYDGPTLSDEGVTFFGETAASIVPPIVAVLDESYHTDHGQHGHDLALSLDIDPMADDAEDQAKTAARLFGKFLATTLEQLQQEDPEKFEQLFSSTAKPREERIRAAMAYNPAGSGGIRMQEYGSD